MKCIQIIFSVALVYFTFVNQVLAFNYSAKTDLIEEVIQAINAATESIIEDGRQQETRVKQLEQELANLATQLDLCLQKSQKEGLQDALKVKIGETSGKDKTATEQAKKIREEAEKRLLVAKRIETLVTQMIEIVEQNRELEKSFVTLTAISKDRAKAAKLIEAIQNNNRTVAAQIINGALLSSSISGVAFSWTAAGASDGGAVSANGTAVNVSEIQNTNTVKITFQIGKILHCFSTNNQCGGKVYSISK